MGKSHKLARQIVKALLIVTVLASLVVAQDPVIISRVTNVNRIAKAWNSIAENTKLWNKEMAKADLLLHARFNNKVFDANEERRNALEEERRKACVGYYKAAREALLNELDALNVLIEEEDY